MKDILIIGHRGCNYPNQNQNTIRAYKTVVDQGATAFEIDVQLTKDNKLVVVHNFDLSKVSTGTGLVRNKTLEEVRALQAGNPPKGEDQIPVLEEVLDLCASYPPQSRPVVHLELKGDGTGIPSAKMVKAYIDSGKLSENDILFSSFNWKELANVQTLLPHIKIALLDGSIRRKELLKALPGQEALFSRLFNYGEEDYMIPKTTDLEACQQLYEMEIEDPKTFDIIMSEVEKAVTGGYYTQSLLDTAQAMGAYSVNLWYDTLVLHKDFVQQAQDRGLKVLVYTVNKPYDIRQVIRMGADGFFTDDFLLANEIVNE